MMEDREILSAIQSGSVSHIEILVEKHEPKVIQMATDLTGSEEQAVRVCEQVFVEVCQAVITGSEEDFEAMLHRITYELALASLLGNIENNNNEVKEVFGQLLGEATSTSVYETTEDCLSVGQFNLKEWRLAETHVRFSELADEALAEMH